MSFVARNHPQKPVDDSVDDRRTPPEFFARLNRIHNFTLDAAASRDNALVDRYCDLASNGLLVSWVGQRVWCNPPYSRLGPWLEKAWYAMEYGGCERVVMLLPANRCEQPFWQKHIEPFRDGKEDRGGIRLTVEFLPGRMRFGFPPGRIRPKKGDRPPFGLVLLTWTR
ncbi:MAG: hypothetical protein KF822_12505 [Steroidobacteraceae bacterium]|nr:hypothetical protein [Steroidobacteraceae bacterium]